MHARAPVAKLASYPIAGIVETGTGNVALIGFADWAILSRLLFVTRLWRSSIVVESGAELAPMVLLRP